MAYTLGDDGLLDFSNCDDEEDKIAQCWEYFVENLSDVEIIACDGKLVRGFTRKTFDHIISGSSNRYDSSLAHDIRFVEARACRIPLISQVITGVIKSKCFRKSKKSGKKSTHRKILCVVEGEHEHYIVVMAEVEDRYAILTAYPSTQTYIDSCIRRDGFDLGNWEK